VPASQRIVVQAVVSTGVIRCRVAPFDNSGFVGSSFNFAAFNGGTLNFEAQLATVASLYLDAGQIAGGDLSGAFPNPAVVSGANIAANTIPGTSVKAATSSAQGAMTAAQNNQLARLNVLAPLVDSSWTPASIPGLELAIRASVGVSATGTTVTSVADQSGKAHTMTAVGTPQIAASAINGKPGFTFSATGQGLVNAADTLFAANEARTVVAVCQPASGGKAVHAGTVGACIGGPILGFQGSVAPTWPQRTFGLLCATIGGQLSFYDDGGYETTELGIPATPPTIAGKPIVLIIRYPGLARPTPGGGAAVAQDACDAHGIGSVWINGVPVTVSNQNGPGAGCIRQEPAVAGFSISSRVAPDTTAFFGGAISEVWAWHGAISDANAALVNQYFCQMYGATPLTDLTSPVRFDDIVSGQISVTVTATDATARKYILTAADIKKCAADLGQAFAHFGYLNFTTAGPRCDLSAFAGKTLSSLALKVDQPFSGGGVNSAGSDIRWYIFNPTANTIAQDSDAGFTLGAGNTQTPTWITAGFTLAADSQLCLNWSWV
jgi:hypothetical protein